MAFQALEISFTIVLVAMLGLAGLIGFAIVVRVVEPRGVRALMQRLRPRRAR